MLFMSIYSVTNFSFFRNKPLQYYCLTCNFAVCQECTIKDHPRPMHVLESIETAATTQLQAIQNLIDEVSVKQGELAIAFRQVETIQRRVNTSLNQAHAKLREAATCMIQAIQDANECLQKDLESTYIHRQVSGDIVCVTKKQIIVIIFVIPLFFQEQIVTVSREVQKMTGKIFQTVKFAQRLLKFGTPAEVMVFKPLLEARLRNFLTFNAETEFILSGNMEIEQPKIDLSQVRVI